MEFSIQFQEQLLFALLSTIIITIFVATILVKGKKNQQRRPPEPDGALPFLGHLHLLGKDQLLHRTFADMADKYGPAFSIRLGVHRALVVSNREVAKECLTTNDKVFLNRPKSLALKHMGYDHNMFGFCPCGPYWRSTRKLVTVELLSSRRLKLLEHVPDTEINSFLKELYEQSVKSGGVAVVDLKEIIGDLTTNTIVRMVAGKRHCGAKGSCDEESRRFQTALSNFLYLVGVFFVSDAVPFLGWLDVVMGNIGKIKRTTKELDFALGSWLNEHRERRHDEDIEGEKDFIDVMLSIMDERNVPSQEADVTIKATCLNLILGGGQTTVVTLTWAISLLLNNRHVLNKARDELDIHVGKQRQVEESDITNLVYLQAIIKETMRLYPAAPLVSRQAMEDCTIAGFHVPSGTQLFVNLCKLQRDPNVWNKPSDFMPERFLSDHANIDVRGQHFELIPFGSGRRICPGITFALRVLHLALARLLHGFEWGTIGDKAIDMSESPGMTNHRATPLEVTLSPKLPSMIYG
ncbi:cytochrome P450, family 82, subfamily C, polypeptide 4 [Hibiscus trionum]|uniref:Cytochrome P450, family 82, subfamily C, polypeptide 4 n=1 Tax=Hibiscus trionum TaxID=183268 RepID=A0A9W7IVZ9_HIBTR|nr:cytochrome P450, family 82, subfamily C, polypeptide 4 [Hibiscus trionum]